MDTPYRGVLVPQEVYTPPAGQRDFDQQNRISFSIDGVLGVRLQDALNPPIPNLQDGNVPPNMRINSARFTVRILVSGMKPKHVVLMVADT